MNANELADRLVDYHDSFLAKDCATMLRQQQAEIDRLKSLCISYIDEEWSGTSSYQAKIDEVKNER